MVAEALEATQQPTRTSLAGLHIGQLRQNNEISHIRNHNIQGSLMASRFFPRTNLSEMELFEKFSVTQE